MNQNNSKSVNRIFPGMYKKKKLPQKKKKNLDNSMGASGEVPAPALININGSFPIDGAHSVGEELGFTVAL